MSVLQRLGQKIKNTDYERLGQKVKRGINMLAHKTVHGLARGAEVGSKLLGVASGVAGAMGVNPASIGLLHGASKGLDKIYQYHEKAQGVQKALGGL